MIQIRWVISGHQGSQEEVFNDTDYEGAYERYARLVEHLRCFDIRMLLIGENSDEVILHEEAYLDSKES